MPAVLHCPPAQQSAVVVHALPHVTQPPPHLPFTHGFKLQQSALVAHAPVTGTQPASAGLLQRGTPRLSCLHVSYCCTLPEQQLSVALQLPDCKRQMSPFGLQL